MICRIVRLFLPLYIEDDLPDWIASRLSRHLAHCDSCVADRQSFMVSQCAVREIATREIPPTQSELFSTQTGSGLQVARIDQEPIHTRTNRQFEWRPLISYSVAAVVLIAAIGYLMEHSSENTKGQTAYSDDSEARTVLTERKPPEFPPQPRAEITALMRRLNPRPHLTDEDLDAEYPVLASVNQPDCVPVVFRTNDPSITVVLLLSRKGASHQ